MGHDDWPIGLLQYKDEHQQLLTILVVVAPPHKIKKMSIQIFSASYTYLQCLNPNNGCAGED